MISVESKPSTHQIQNTEHTNLQFNATNPTINNVTSRNFANDSQPDYPNGCAQKQKRKRTPLKEYLSKKRKKNYIHKERKQLEIYLQNHGKFQNEFAKFQTAKDVENSDKSVVKCMRKKVKSKLSSYQS